MISVQVLEYVRPNRTTRTRTVEVSSEIAEMVARLELAGWRLSIEHVPGSGMLFAIERARSGAHPQVTRDLATEIVGPQDDTAEIIEGAIRAAICLLEQDKSAGREVIKDRILARAKIRGRLRDVDLIDIVGGKSEDRRRHSARRFLRELAEDGLLARVGFGPGGCNEYARIEEAHG